MRSVWVRHTMSGNPILAQHFGNVSYLPQNASTHFREERNSVFQSCRQITVAPHEASFQCEPETSRVRSRSTESNTEKNDSDAISANYRNLRKSSSSSTDDDYDGSTGFSHFGSTTYRKIVQFFPTGKKSTTSDHVSRRSSSSSSRVSTAATPISEGGRGESAPAKREGNTAVHHSPFTCSLSPSSSLGVSREVDTSANRIPGGQPLFPEDFPSPTGAFSPPQNKWSAPYAIPRSPEMLESLGAGGENIELEGKYDNQKEEEASGYMKRKPTMEQHYFDAVPAIGTNVTQGTANARVHPFFLSQPGKGVTELPLDQLLTHSKSVLNDAKRICESSRAQGACLPSTTRVNSFQPASYAIDNKVKESNDRYHSGGKVNLPRGLTEGVEEESARVNLQSSEKTSPVVAEKGNASPPSTFSSSPSCPHLSVREIQQPRTEARSILEDERVQKERSHKDNPPGKIVVSVTDRPHEILEVRTRRRWHPPSLPGAPGAGGYTSRTLGCRTDGARYQMIEEAKSVPLHPETGPATPISSQKEDGRTPPSPSLSSSVTSKNAKPYPESRMKSPISPVGNILSVDSLVTIIEKLTTLLHPQPPSMQQQIPMSERAPYSKPHRDQLYPSGRRRPKSPKAVVHAPRGRLLNAKQLVATPTSTRQSSRSTNILKVHTPIRLSSSNSASTSPFAKSSPGMQHTSGKRPPSTIPSGTSTLALSVKKSSRGLRTRQSGSRVPFYALPTQNWLCKHSKDADLSVGYHSSGSGGSSSND